MPSPRLLLTAVALLLFTAAAHAQVLVYKLDFNHDKGVNYHPFTGGYFVAPILGGEGSFLLTSTRDERVYLESSGGGRLFTAVSRGERKAVISASTGGGSASGALVALGEINHTVVVRGPTYSLDARVARSLNGTAVSADDESSMQEPAQDGSLGSAGISELKITLDEEETNRANRREAGVDQTMEQLKLELEREGFHNVNDDDGNDGDQETNGEADQEAEGAEPS